MLGPLFFLVVCLGATSSVVADVTCLKIHGPHEEYVFCGTEDQVAEVEELAADGWPRAIAVYAAGNGVSAVEAYALVHEVSPEVASFALVNEVSAGVVDNHFKNKVCIPADFDNTNKLDHHPIIVIHGVFLPDLLNPPSCEDLRHRHTGSEHAQSDFASLFKANTDPVPDFWDQHLTARIDWSSKDRLDDVIKKNVFPVFRRLSEESICKPNGCVLVTHSTGDLIGSKWLDEGPKMLADAGLENVDIVASFDFAGAAGGVELTEFTLDRLSVEDAATTSLGIFGLFHPSFSETALEKNSFTWLLSALLFLRLLKRYGGKMRVLCKTW